MKKVALVFVLTLLFAGPSSAQTDDLQRWQKQASNVNSGSMYFSGIMFKVSQGLWHKPLYTNYLRFPT